jgi:predicted nucleic acid-binding protein
MHKTIISDTSCFIVLTNIGELELLQKVYGQVVTTIEVVTEFGETLPEWVIIETVRDKYKQQLLEMQVDKGEASAIALALGSDESTVILDDYRARKLAKKLRLTYTGTIGVIVKAKLQGIISSIKPILVKIKQTDFRISDEIELQALLEAGEYEQP